MISDEEKQQAWGWLHLTMLGMPTQNPITQKQFDYLLTYSMRKSHPGAHGEALRTVVRRRNLAIAVCILKARDPSKSYSEIFKEVSRHYKKEDPNARVSQRLVKEAYYNNGKLEGVTEQAKRATAFLGDEVSFTEADLAQYELPHINFENFPDE